MMKTYEKPCMEIIVLEDDIITTSFGGSHEGFEDGDVVEW